MSTTRVLIINTMDGIGGDTSMLLMGVSILSAPAFHVYAVSIPRGQTYEYLRSLPNVTVRTMELGGKEAPPARPLGRLQQFLETTSAIFRIAALVKREQIDVIYTLDRSISMSISYIVSLITGCPLLFGAHISVYLEHSRHHRLALKHARRITVVSQFLHKSFLPYVDDPNKLVIIPNAIWIERYDPGMSGNEIREEYGIPKDAKVVVLMGRINPWKGQREMVHAAAIILEQYPDTYFLIVGGGEADYIDEIKHLANELKVGHRFHFLGYRSDVPEVLATADIVTMPSHGESFGLVALEGMAMAKPVVACRVGGIPEFMTDGETGFLVTPKDHQDLAQAILKLLNDPQRAAQMGKVGRQKALRNYSSQIYGVQIAGLIKHMAR